MCLDGTVVASWSLTLEASALNPLMTNICCCWNQAEYCCAVHKIPKKFNVFPLDLAPGGWHSSIKPLPIFLTQSHNPSSLMQSCGRKSEVGSLMALSYHIILWRGNVFTSICDSVHGWRCASPGQTPPGHTSPRADTSPPWPLQRTVCILLECILVWHSIDFTVLEYLWICIINVQVCSTCISFLNRSLRRANLENWEEQNWDNLLVFSKLDKLDKMNEITHAWNRIYLQAHTSTKNFQVY